jgi:hypothetical protein
VWENQAALPGLFPFGSMNCSGDETWLFHTKTVAG